MRTKRRICAGSETAAMRSEQTGRPLSRPRTSGGRISSSGITGRKEAGSDVWGMDRTACMRHLGKGRAPPVTGTIDRRQ